MSFSKPGESLAAREILDLIGEDLRRVEQEIDLESMASVNAVTTISRYLSGNGGKRLRPTLLLLSARLIGSVNDSARLTLDQSRIVCVRPQRSDMTPPAIDPPMLAT